LGKVQVEAKVEVMPLKTKVEVEAKVKAEVGGGDRPSVRLT